MNSRQLNFYLNLSDQHLFDQMLRADGQTKLCRYQTEQASPCFLKSSIIRKMGEEPLKIVLVRKSDIEDIQYRKIRDRNIYSIDTLRSPVIEYSRCYVGDNVIRRGRLFFVKTYYDDKDVLIKKSSDFLAWANQMLGDARYSLTSYLSGDLIGSGASLDRTSGVEFISV